MEVLPSEEAANHRFELFGEVNADCDHGRHVTCAIHHLHKAEYLVESCAAYHYTTYPSPLDPT